jgi:uncharacterized protein YndB with AHSA1/START domain
MVDLSGVGAEVSVLIAARPEVVWELVTDLTRTPEWNRETLETVWVPPHTGPELGAVFRATNRIGDWQWDVECHVTRADPQVAFEWTVSPPDHPSTSWWHRLLQTDPGTELRHGFQHGPGGSGLRAMVEQNPEHAAAIIERRTEMLADNMRHTLERIKALAERPA